MRLLLATLALLPVLAAAEPPGPRGGTDEWSLNLLVIGSSRYEFEGGASLRNDGGAGIGLSLTRNLNNYFAIGVEGTLAEFDYRASVAPAAGNAAAGFETDGDMETATLRLYATWNLLARPLTPFITAGAGVTFLDANFGAGAPANACWIYPLYGQVCGEKPPGTTLTRFSYGAGVGLRLEFPRKQGFVRAYFGGEWIEIGEALGSVGYFQMRADFGIPF